MRNEGAELKIYFFFSKVLRVHSVTRKTTICYTKGNVLYQLFQTASNFMGKFLIAPLFNLISLANEFSYRKNHANHRSTPKVKTTCQRIKVNYQIP